MKHKPYLDDTREQSEARHALKFMDGGDFKRIDSMRGDQVVNAMVSFGFIWRNDRWEDRPEGEDAFDDLLVWWDAVNCQRCASALNPSDIRPSLNGEFCIWACGNCGKSHTAKELEPLLYEVSR